MPDTPQKREVCPRCGSKNTGMYHYGYPLPQLWELVQSSEGAHILGGCCIDALPGRNGEITTSPRFHCHDCKRDFGSTAMYRLKGDEELYSECAEGATMVEFQVGGHPGPFYHARLTPDCLYLHAIPCYYGSLGPDEERALNCQLKKEVPISGRKFRALARKLFDRLYLGDWKRRYVDLDVLDGTWWELRVRLDNAKRSIVIHGQNDFPPHYDKLISLLRKLAHQNGMPFEGDGFSLDSKWLRNNPADLEV